MTHVLLAEGVRFAYGAMTPVIVDLNLRIEQGEGLALLGPNGAGKSTVLKLGMAFLRPVSGYIVSAGNDTRKSFPEQLASQVGFMFQQPDDQLFAPTVRDELRFGPRRFGWSRGEIDHRLAELLSELGLDAVADSHPHDLPLPMRKMVALGCALMLRPQLLLLDEPTAGLDHRSKARLIEIVRNEMAAGVGVLAVTHDAEFALEALSHAALLESGMVRAEGSVRDVLGSGAAGLPALPDAVQVIDRLGLAAASPRRADLAAALAAHLGALTVE